MPRRRESVTPRDVNEVLASRIADHDKALSRIKQSKMGAVQVIDIDNFNDPAEGMVVINWPTTQFCFYHNNEWICMPVKCHAIKVYTDRKNTKVEDGAFRFAVEPDLHDHDIVMTKAFVGTAGDSTSLTIENHTRGLTILSSSMVIPGGGLVSGPAATTLTTIIDTEVAGRRINNVHEDDMIWINVQSGSTTKGLGLYIYFNKPLVDNTV